MIEDCAVLRLLYKGSGTGKFRGIHINCGANQLVRECVVAIEGATLGASHVGIFLPAPSAIYRDNTLIGFATTYALGTDGGGSA